MGWLVDEKLCQDWADSLIKRHNAKRFEEPHKVDPYDLIDIIGARLSIDYLTPTREYLGATVFQDSCLWIWPDVPYFTGMLPMKKFYHKNTIIIDKDLAESDVNMDKKITNYTFVHEAMHFENHESKITKGYHKCQNSKSGKNPIEQEADYGAALFWMPKNAVLNVFREEFKIKNGPSFPLPFCYDTKPTIQKMAKIFDVNYSPMVYRLQELELIERNWGKTW